MVGQQERGGGEEKGGEDNVSRVRKGVRSWKKGEGGWIVKRQ